MKEIFLTEKEMVFLVLLYLYEKTEKQVSIFVPLEKPLNVKSDGQRAFHFTLFKKKKKKGFFQKWSKMSCTKQ